MKNKKVPQQGLLYPHNKIPLIRKYHQRSSLSTYALADIYTQLSRLEKTAFSGQQAYNMLTISNGRIQKKLQQLQNYLKLGYSISDAGFMAGIFSSSDHELLHIGETSGKLALIYQQLADYYGDKAKNHHQIKSQLLLPISIFILALFIQPISALALGEITVWQYLFISLKPLFTLAIIVYLIINLPYWFTSGQLHFFGLSKLLFKIQLTFPLLSRLIIARQTNKFLHTLGIMLSAGIPIQQVLPNAVMTIDNPLLRKQFNSALLAIMYKQSLTQALTNISAINNKTLQQIKAGELSGKLADTLLHITKLGHEKINLQDNLLAEWIPRIAYALIIIWLASSILTSYTQNT